MKQWVQKLLQQFEVEKPSANPENKSFIGSGNLNLAYKSAGELDEDKATLLYILDIFNKHAIETDNYSVRKVRENIDEISKQLVYGPAAESEKVLFKLRQFLLSYRIDEYSFIQKTFDDFKRIIWDFADQLSEDVELEQSKEAEIKVSLDQLREAVESNSIHALKAKSREFINNYIEFQSKKDERRAKRISHIRKNLTSVKRKLVEANHSMVRDHLTNAFNRRSFDEQIRKSHKMFEISQTPLTLVALDIDHFKKVNDTYGHHIGDFVLKECVRLLKESFSSENEFVARLGGEEFGVILTDCKTDQAFKKAQDCLVLIQKTILVQGNHEIRFTVSMGIATLLENESVEQLMSRADKALYQSKHGGRNQVTMASNLKIESIAS